MSRLLAGAVVITLASMVNAQQPYERVTVTERFAPVSNAPVAAPVVVYRSVPVYSAPVVMYSAPMVLYAAPAKYATSVDTYGLFGRRVRVNYSDGTSRRVR